MMENEVLFITPDLSLTGANVVLLELIGLLKNKGVHINVLASADGEFHSRLENKGIKIIISPYVKSDITIQTIKRDYKYVFLNTSSVHFYAMYFQNTSIPVYWWFHESFEQLINERENFIHLGLLSNNFKILAVTNKVSRGLKDIYGVDAEILPMPIEDVFYKEAKNVENNYCEKNVVEFFVPAAYTPVKGQDVLCRAVSMMPAEYRERSKFIFAGYKIKNQEKYFETILKMAKLLGNIEIYEALPREQIYEMYDQCDCVIAPSRADSTPTTIVEGLMFGKVCVVSDGTGISEYIIDCESGFIFSNENAEELANILIAIIDNINELKPIADAGRLLYEGMYLPDIVEKIFFEIVD